MRDLKGANTNPAPALYHFWDDLLVTMGWGKMHFGPKRGWGIFREGDDKICLGPIYSWSSYPYWKLRSDGAFQFQPLWGYEQRNGVGATIPFLAWGYRARTYQWAVGFDSRQFTTDWENPIKYVSEPLIGARGWNVDRVWCELERDETNRWCIVPSKIQEALNYDDLLGRWDRYNALIQRRYLQDEKAQRARQGKEPLSRSRKAPVLREGNKAVAQELVTSRLIAMLEVDKPASVKKMIRNNLPEEGTRGANHMDSAHTV